LDSIASQEDQEYKVCVVDDASDELMQRDIVKRYCNERGWERIQQTVRQGSMYNQWLAWNKMEPTDSDVIVWCDLDDRLAHPNVLNILREHYDGGAVMTYGSYRTEPHSPTSHPAQPYPDSVITNRSYRTHNLLLFNHLRTVSWPVLRLLDESDFKDNAGEWLMTGPDAAVMLPALEISGKRCHVIEEVLYVYNADHENAEWIVDPKLVNKNHQQVMGRPPKDITI
jgi:glycosyltransferase involved in cell wall biosynthesis